jgi:peptidyl-prolyl cis-trans isomerase C
MSRDRCIYPKIALVSVIVSFFVFQQFPATAQTSTQTLATVDQTDISRQELDREMRMVSFKLTRQGRPVSLAELTKYEKEILETLISRVLMLNQAEVLDVGVKESLVSKAMDELKASFEGENAYQTELEKMGFTEEMMERQVREGLVIRELLDKEVLKGTLVSDEQVSAFYKENPERFKQPAQVKASHILIEVSQDASATKKEKARTTLQGLKQRIESGASFSVMAQEYSDCPSKARGGDLGFFTKEQMVPPFSEAAFELSPGEVSDLVETRFGYHLIKVTERKPEHTLAFNDVKKEISARLRREEEGKRINAYLKKLESEAEIQRYPL